MELKFEWDDEKAAINLKKHKVAFEDAVYVFQDDNRIEFLMLNIATKKTDMLLLEWLELSYLLSLLKGKT